MAIETGVAALLTLGEYAPPIADLETPICLGISTPTRRAAQAQSSGLASPAAPERDTFNDPAREEHV